jgi:HEAT repeat protein
MIRSFVAFAALFPALAMANVPLAPDAAVTLKAEVEAARQATPRAFAAVDALFAQLPALDARKRGGLLPVGPMLKPLGADGVMPLLEELAFVDRAGAAADLPPGATLAWRVGVLEALGAQRDPRARAVLESAVQQPGAPFEVTRAAAEALGRLGDDAAARFLVHHSRTGPHAQAVLSGMGACRRAAVALRLAEAAAASESPEQAHRLVRALGEVGNSWAWQTPAVRAFAAEESRVREVAAAALVAAFVRFDGEVRQEASNALLVVDAPQTPALVAKARQKADPETSAALNALVERLATNPLR